MPGAPDPGTAPGHVLVVVPQQFGLLPELSLAESVAVTAELSGTGVLVASHDPEVVAAADRVVRLADGRVV